MSQSKTTAPYGTWPSSISPDLIVAETVRLMDLTLTDEAIYWLEMRPQEQGRYVIVRMGADGQAGDVNSAPFNARTRVHEYGGAPFLVVGQGVYFSNFDDQRIYHQSGDGAPTPITRADGCRYADAQFDATRSRLLCVREDHSHGAAEPTNSIVGIGTDGPSLGVETVLCQGADFYASPRLSPDATQLAWVSWSHPNMPWDGSQLWLADLDAEGCPQTPRLIAGGPEESVMQPEFSPGGRLYFVSDRSGWWNLYRTADGAPEALCPMAAEFGVPPWVFADRRYVIESEQRIVCAYQEQGVGRLASLHPESRQLATIDVPYTALAYLQASAGRVAFLAASPGESDTLVTLDLETSEIEVVRRSSPVAIDPENLSSPEAIEFATENALSAYGFYYPPRNCDYCGPAGESPPLLVISHGGPTGYSTDTLKLSVQYWTSRGFAVLDVNYGGSSGHGREYRQRLRGQWGVVDVDDCVNGARHLVQAGLADPQRLAIRGNSAGGYTTLSALTFRDVFRAGASYYGVSDLQSLIDETHKFESRYLDGLIGDYPACADLYKERSPIHFVSRLSCPVIFFQGLEDRIVPPAQAQTMVDALRAEGLPVAYIAFAGEQHGFRGAATIKRALEAELYFYSRVFGLHRADVSNSITIENLD